MLRKLLPVLLAAALAALVVGGLSAARGGGTARHGDSTMTFLDITTRTTSIDVDQSKSFTIGDENIFRDVLKTPSGSRRVGTLDVVCTAVSAVSEAKGRAHCLGTADLQGGTIEFGGTVAFAPNQETIFKIAITGGTRNFDTAGGELRIHEIGPNRAIVHADIDRF
jgi:hypothetical protein